MSRSARVSVILATYNRRDVTLATLARVLSTVPREAETEVLVVDNGSADGTPEAIRRRYPDVRLIPSPRNMGSCAKALAVSEASGDYILFLDDDSNPRPGSVARMIDHFATNETLAAAGFRVHLPDGREESSALPGVFVGCGVGLRADALRAVGGLDADLFMQAEEYHLAFRLVNAGWTIRRFEDLSVDHLKTIRARRSRRTTYYDTRNNMLLALRYLPAPLHAVYARDWAERYRWLAWSVGHRRTFTRGWSVGTVRGWYDRVSERFEPLRDHAVELLFQLEGVTQRMHELRRDGAQRIVLADLGKNVHAFRRGAINAGIAVAAIGDDHFAAPGRRYRGIQIVPLGKALSSGADAVVIANMSPVHAARSACRVADISPLPVYDWFSPANRFDRNTSGALRPAAV